MGFARCQVNRAWTYPRRSTSGSPSSEWAPVPRTQTTGSGTLNPALLKLFSSLGQEACPQTSFADHNEKQSSAALPVPQDPFPGHCKAAADFSRCWFMKDTFHPLFARLKSNFMLFMAGRVLQQNSERRDRQMFPAWPFSLTQTVPRSHRRRMQLQPGLVPVCLAASLLRLPSALL